MNILIVGSGGREHALAWAVSRSPKAEKIFCAPGNAGTADFCENINIQADDIKALVDFAEKNNAGLTIVGPEVPLVNGIADEFAAKGLKIFGPLKAGARLEGSKSFTKNILKKYDIPTADFAEFTESGAAKEYIDSYDKFPVVVKADGLAAGKGVIICKNRDETAAAISEIMDDKVFKEAGDRVVIEEFLEGDEASILAFTDGESVLPLPPSQDHKRIGDGDEGPNTGGMGAYAPTPLIKEQETEKIKEEILLRTINALKNEGIEYKGILYAGLMMTKQGPKVLEYNVRFGDPETQAVLPLLKTDIIDLFMACIEGRLDSVKTETTGKSAVCIVLASEGYPGAYEKEKEIKGLDSFEGREDIIVFHAGTKKKDSKTVTSGGRVLGFVSVGRDIPSAISAAYKEIDKITFDGVYYRRDIGAKAEKYI